MLIKWLYCNKQSPCFSQIILFPIYVTIYTTPSISVDAKYSNSALYTNVYDGLSEIY